MAEGFAAVFDRHPLGLGAGPDRYGERSGRGLGDAITAGFAFIELGTVTPEAEPGHNPGAAVLAACLARRPNSKDCAVGVSVGSRFAAAPQQIAGDWCIAIEMLESAADFFTINLSAPYYASLLQPGQGKVVIGALARARHALRAAVPLLVKLPFGRPPEDEAVSDLLPALADCGLDAVVVSSSPSATAAAGEHIALTRRICRLPVVATGGVRTPADLRHRLEAGASLVQVYSVYADKAATPGLPSLVDAARLYRRG